MTTPFKSQVNTIPQYIWKSHLTLMERGRINGKPKYSVI
jgi:hypothetical protein